MPDTLARQRSLAALILDEAGPEDGNPLSVYRELVRMSLADPVETMFPIAKALLEEEGGWQELLDAFLAARCVPSTHYRDVAPAFLGWCAKNPDRLARWPFLLELLHFELLETLVCRFPDLPEPPGLAPEPGPGTRVVLAPATQVVTYGHAVHRCTEEAPRPPKAATHLLAFRDGEGSFQLMEVTGGTAALLAGHRPLEEAFAALGLQDPAPTLRLLEDLRAAGAILGFTAGPERP